MSSPRTGGCLCGKVRYKTGEAAFAVHCYCRDCQHISGGGHAPQFAVKRDAISRSGPLQTYDIKADSGHDVEFGFCRECGSPIYKTTTRLPDVVFFFAGSLDDPTLFDGSMKVYEERRQPWDHS